MARRRVVFRAGSKPALVLVVLAVLAGVVVVADGPRSMPYPAGPVLEAPDSGAAMVAARHQGGPVRVADLTTSTRLVSSEPDGTMSAVLSAVPVRVRRGGSWIPTDTTIAANADGSVGPRAVPDGVRFSGGGTQPLVHFEHEGHRLEVRWPAPLPRPSWRADAVTYRDVLPGVDLELRAQVEGYGQQLVVRDAAAAASSSVDAIRLGVSADGLSLRSHGSGRLDAVDATGAVVFTTPASVMWDATGRRAAVGVDVVDGGVVLRPDLGLLRAAGTRFPVVIDPDWRSFGRIGWAKVFSGKAGTEYWNGAGDDDGWAKVGNCADWPNCNGIGIARSYFQYDTGFLAGKRLLSASFDTAVVYGPSCGARDHQLVYANGPIDAGTNWNNAPGGRVLGTQAVGSNYSSCSGNKPVGFSVLGGINTGGWSTYFLRAADEGDKFAWRKYDAGVTQLRVNYNTRPNAPYELKTDPPLPSPCRWCGGTPYVGDSSIRLAARLSDPDNDQLHPIWTIYGGSAPENRDVGPTQISGAYFSTSVDLRGRNGQNVSWTVWGSDGVDGGDWRNGPGPFVVDQVGVDRPPTVVGQLYAEDNSWHGGVGVAGSFTFGASGVGDIDHYLYGWNDPPATSVDANALGGSAMVSLTPPGDGPRDLYVQSVDRAGHRSPTRTYHFYVRPGNGPLAQWSLEGSTTDSANLGFRDGTRHGAANYAPGAVGAGLAFGGSSDYFSAPAPARTDAGFSVSSWVKLAEKTTGWSTALAQNGTNTSAIRLGYTGTGSDRWAVQLRGSDSANAAMTTVSSAQIAQTGVWTHLAAVYDDATDRVTLYVNGVPAGNATWSTPWAGTGEFQAGQVCTGPNTWGDRLVGAVDEIRVYDRVATEAEIRATIGRDNVATGYWPFDQVDGTTSPNAVPGGDMAVLHPGAAFAPRAAVNGGLTLDGTGGYADTGAPAARTDQSYAIAGWVNPAGRGSMTAVSQDGLAVSGGYLRQDNGTWVFGMRATDTAGAPLIEARSTANVVQPGTWTHLAGVYNAPDNRLTLYVNGVAAGTATGPAQPWNALGALAIGRGLAGGPVEHWSGSLDEVRTYSRVLSVDEIQGIVAQGAVTAATWKLDGNANDASGRDLHGTLVGTPEWSGGQTTYPDAGDLAVKLNGTTTAVSAPKAADTDKSYSVAAWVKLESRTSGFASVVSQSGSRTSAFNLAYGGSGGDHWAVALHGPDSDAPTSVTRVFSTQTAQLGVWTHLAAVYNATTATVSLYVNGVPSATGTFTDRWNATGEIGIGRAKWAGAWTNYLPGAVDDVSVYNRILFSDEIATMAGRDLTLVHNWQFDEPSGTTAADAIGTRAATLAGDATFAPGRSGNALHLDGSTGTAATTGLDLRTDQSFTVSAWVYLDRRSDTVSQFTAVSQSGSRTSKFRLGHVADEMRSTCFGGEYDDPDACGAWTFEMSEDDSNAPVVTKAAVSALPAEINTWTHLVGVYDKQTHKTWLYVNGIRFGDGTLNTAWATNGSLRVGAGTVAATSTQFWPGSVDDVRVYTGALGRDRVDALYRSYPAIDPTLGSVPTPDAGWWPLDDGTGSTAADASGAGHPATASGTPGWVAGRIGGALTLDGTRSSLQTAGPVLNTAGSFSVAGWAYLGDTAGGDRVLLAQDGSRTSAFTLGYQGASGKWAATTAASDQDSPSRTMLTSSTSAVAGIWTQLGFVYDAATRQSRLYVNGALEAVTTGAVPFSATGDFTIGRARERGAGAAWFTYAVDDVRAYGTALTDSQIRLMHTQAPSPDAGIWRFDDGTGVDSTLRHANATVTGGASYTPGVSWQGLTLDGQSGQASVPNVASTFTAGSYTVSAWARLSRTDRVATVLALAGSRMNAFALQYRPELGRWIFAVPERDADLAPLTYAGSTQQAVQLDRWTQLSGVYDSGRRELRLYVDGALAGVRGNVAPWKATGALLIGRGVNNGVAEGYFPGSIDEVRAAAGSTDDGELARRGNWPTPLAGQLGRFVDRFGNHRTAATTTPPEGFHAERTLGLLVPAGIPGTRVAYSCLDGADGFTSLDSGCEGRTSTGDTLTLYANPPSTLDTVAVYRCVGPRGHFDSRQADCEGAAREGVLGYVPAFAGLMRLFDRTDHATTVNGSAPGYTTEGGHGYLALTARSGTRALYGCRSGAEQFVSLDSACEGKTVIESLGYLWSQATEGAGTRALYRCTAGLDSFTSVRADCEGLAGGQLIGYLLPTAPDPAGSP